MQQTSTTVSPSPTGTPAAVVVADSGAEPPGAPVALAPPPEQVLAAAPSTEQATVQASAQAPPSAAAQATVQASTALQATSGAESVALEPSISSGAEASAPLGQEASETPSTQPSPNTSEGEGKDKESSPCDDAGAPLAPAAREARVPAVTEGVAPSKGDVKEYKDAMPEAEETAEEPGKSTAVGTLATGEGLTTPQVRDPVVLCCEGDSTSYTLPWTVDNVSSLRMKSPVVGLHYFLCVRPRVCVLRHIISLYFRENIRTYVRYGEVRYSMSGLIPSLEMVQPRERV